MTTEELVKRLTALMEDRPETKTWQVLHGDTWTDSYDSKLALINWFGPNSETIIIDEG